MAVSNRKICFIKAVLLLCEYGHFSLTRTERNRGWEKEKNRQEWQRGKKSGTTYLPGLLYVHVELVTPVEVPHQGPPLVVQVQGVLIRGVTGGSKNTFKSCTDFGIRIESDRIRISGEKSLIIITAIFFSYRFMTKINNTSPNIYKIAGWSKSFCVFIIVFFLSVSSLVSTSCWRGRGRAQGEPIRPPPPIAPI